MTAYREKRVLLVNQYKRSNHHSITIFNIQWSTHKIHISLIEQAIDIHKLLKYGDALG